MESEVKNSISFRQHFLRCSQSKQLCIPRRKYLHMVFQATSNAWAGVERNMGGGSEYDMKFETSFIQI